MAGGELKRLILQNNLVRLGLLPEVGGKITSLVYLPSNHEFIFQPPEPQKGYRVPGYGSLFKDFDNSGFDECIPTVAACQYPVVPFRNEQLPDHGEVWSVPWKVSSAANAGATQVAMECSGRRLPYIFRRWLKLEGAKLLIDYQIESLSSSPLHYLWSSHPLLNISEGDRILLPQGVTEMFIDQSHSGRLGKFGDHCGWPVAKLRDGSTADLSHIAPKTAGTAEKYFTPRLRDGWCALESHSTGHRMRFDFDPDAVPFIGLWINQGGWPLDAARKDYCVAIEPCSGAPDSLEMAVEYKQANILGAFEKRNWSVGLQVETLRASG